MHVFNACENTIPPLGIHCLVTDAVIVTKVYKGDGGDKWNKKSGEDKLARCDQELNVVEEERDRQMMTDDG